MSTKMKRLMLVIVSALILAIALGVNAFAARDAVGDLNRDGVKDENDAIYLLNHYIFGGVIGGGSYDIDQPSDYNGDGVIDEDDAIYLLNNILFGDINDSYHICDHPDTWEIAEIVSATCKEGGYTVVKCQCGKEEHILPTEKTNDHSFDWENPDLTHQATCLENGYITAACSVCGKTDTQQQQATGEHKWEGGSCEKGAVCKFCDTELPSIGHKYSTEPTFVKEATCKGGYAEYKCENDGCESIYKVDLAPTDHRFAENAWQIVGDRATDVKCLYVYVEAAKCEDCGETFERTTGQVEKHTEVTTVTPATCVKDGQKTISCSVCTKVLLKTTMPVPTDDAAKAHKFDDGVVNGSVTTFTCTVEGCGATKTTVKASEDGKVDIGAAEEVELNNGAAIIPDENIKNELGGKDVSVSIGEVKADDLDKLNDDDKALLKELGDAPIFDLNLMADGEKVTNFGENNKMTVRLPYTLADGDDPDCIIIWYIGDDGHIDHFEAKYVDGYAVFETSHFSYYTVTRMTPAQRCEYYGSHNNQTTEVPATCVTGGYTLNICTRCGYKEITNEVPAIGHNWDITKIEATCTNNGATVYKCKACEISYSDIIMATGHNIVEATDKYKAPTCTVKGEKIYVCSNNNCEFSYKEDVAQIDHDYEKILFAATCDTDGFVLNDCKNCDSSFTSDIIKAIGHNYDAGVCGNCGHECEHDYQYGVCVICNLEKEKPVIPEEPKPEDPDCKHEITYSYEFLNTNAPMCKNGVIITESCKYCDYTNTYTTYECVTWLVEVDLSKYDHCGNHNFSYYTCPCGFDTEWVGDVNLDESEEGGYCKDCAMRATFEYNRGKNGCVYYMELTIKFYFGDEFIHEIAYTYYEEEHDYTYTYEFLDKDIPMCENGVVITKSCKHCDYSNTYTTYECETWLVEVDLSKYDHCGNHNFSYYTCPCGNETDWAEEGNINLEETREGAYCKECAMRATFEYVEGENGCIYYEGMTIKFYFGDEFIHELSVVYYDEDHDYTYTFEFLDGVNCENGVVYKATCSKCGNENTTTHYKHFYDVYEEIDLASYGACEHHEITRISCPCGARATAHINGLDHGFSMEPGKDYYFCGADKCGIHIDVTINGGDMNDKCEITYVSDYIVYNNKEEIASFKTVDVFTNHNYEEHFEMLGSTCDDGYIVTAVCQNCGYSYTEEGYGHIYGEQPLDLSEYGICERHNIRKHGCLHCDYITNIWYEDMYSQRLDNGWYMFCEDCPVAIYEIEEYGERDENCHVSITWYGSLLCGDDIILEYTSFGGTVDHDYEETFELLGKTCEDGVRVTGVCKNCGESYTDEITGHYTQDIELDLTQYGACEKHYVHGSVCTVCGMIDYIKFGGFKRQVLKDGGILWFCKECNTEILQTEKLGAKDENCFVAIDVSYVITVNGTEVFNKTSTAGRYDHNILLTYEFMEGSKSCDDGVKVYETCVDCGNTNTHYTYGHQTQNIEIDLSSYKVCDSHKLTVDQCMVCGQQGNISFDDCCYQEITNGARYFCDRCDLEMIAIDRYGNKDENCGVSFTRHYSLRYNGTEVFTGAGQLFTTLHDMERSYEFNDIDLGCEGGVRIIETCRDCGQSEQWEENGHCTYPAETYKLADYGHNCATGEIEIMSCPCGFKKHVNINASGFSDYTDGKDINGIYHDITNWYCDKCKYEIIEDNYFVKDQFCNAIQYTEFAFGGQTVSIQRNGGKEHNTSEKELEDESFTIKNDDGTMLRVTATEIYCQDCKASIFKCIRTESYDVNGYVTKVVNETYRYETVDGIVTDAIIEQKEETGYIILDSLNGKEKISRPLYTYRSDYDSEGNEYYWHRVEYIYENNNYCFYTAEITDSNGNSWTESNSNKHYGTWTTYVLAEGSKSCLDGLERINCCVLCGTETKRSPYTSKNHRFNNNAEPVASFDLKDYGAVCEGVLEIRECVCGVEKQIKNDFKCEFDWTRSKETTDENGGVHYYEIYTCAVSNCGFKYVRGVDLYSDAECNEVRTYTYYFGVDEKNQSYLDSYSYTYKTGEKRHAEIKTNVFVNDERYYYSEVCSKCGKVSHTVTIENGIRTEIGYSYHQNGVVSHKYENRYLAIDKYGDDYIIFSRSENYDTDGKWTWWSQSEYTYPNAANGDYCTVTRVDTSMNGESKTETYDTHSWWRYGGGCTPEYVEQHCSKCGATRTSLINYSGHSYKYDEATGMYVCGNCGLESFTDGDGKVVFEDKTKELGGGDKYVVGWANNYGKEYFWSVSVINPITNGFIFLDNITPVETDDHTVILDAIAISEAVKEYGFVNCNYMIRLTFVPADGNGELDYSITLDPHAYKLTGHSYPKDGCESGYDYTWEYTCVFCGDSYTESKNGHYFGDNGNSKSVDVAADGSIKVTNTYGSTCELCGEKRVHTYVDTYAPNGQLMGRVSVNGDGSVTNVSYEYDYVNKTRTEIEIDESGNKYTRVYDMVSGENLSRKNEYTDGSISESTYFYVDGSRYTSYEKQIDADQSWIESFYTYDFDKDIRIVRTTYSDGRTEELHSSISEYRLWYRREVMADGNWVEMNLVYNEADNTYTETTRNSDGYECVIVKLYENGKTYDISRIIRYANGDTEEWYYQMIGGENRIVKNRLDKTDGVWSQNVYTYDLAKDVMTRTYIDSYNNTTVARNRISDGLALYVRETWNDGWSETVYVYDMENDTRTMTTNYSDGRVTTKVIIWSSRKTLLLEDKYSDGSWEKTEFEYNENGTRKTRIQTRSNGYKYIANYDGSGNLMSEKIWETNGNFVEMYHSYVDKDKFYCHYQLVTFSEGDVQTIERKYMYHNDSSYLTSEIYCMRDGSKSFEERSYDFSNDIFTRIYTNTEGITTVTQYYISNNMPVA